MIISIQNETLTLNMGITPIDFAKSRISQMITDEGYYVEFKDNNFTITPWRFSSTSENKGLIEVKGELPNGNKTLYEIITKSNQTEKKECINKLICFYEYVIKNKLEIPIIGPLGTVFCNDGSFLLLPNEFFSRAVIKLSDEEYSNVQGCWINSALTGSNAIRFLLSVYIYHYVSGRLPYTNKNSQERTEDFYDKNYVPFIYTSGKLNEETSRIIDKYLSLDAAFSSKKKGKQQEKILTVSIDNIDSYYDENKEETKEKAQELLNKRQAISNKIFSKVKRRRFLRQKNTILLVSTAIFCVIGLSIISTIHDKRQLPTTVGMTSIETIESFYTGVNNLDTSLLDATTVNSGSAKPYKNLVDGYYVTSKYRTSVESQYATYPLTEWLYFKNQTQFTIFGVSNLQINQKPADCQSTIYQINNKDKTKLLTEFGQEIKEKDSKTYIATGYIVFTEGVDVLSIMKFTDTIDMAYLKDRWKIVKITNNWEELSVDYPSFITDYAKSLEGISDIKDISSSLKNTYDWIPTTIEIEKAGEILQRKIEENDLSF